MFFLQTLLFTMLLVVLICGGLWVAYRSRFGGSQRWIEATRHRHRLEMKIGRWIWFRWIHHDCQYWILHVDFSQGPIVLEGEAPAGSYWSFTYNTWTETNPSVNSRTATLNGRRYRILLSSEEGEGDRIPVRREARRGVIYFRIYEPPGAFPSQLPKVTQNGRLLTREALS